MTIKPARHTNDPAMGRIRMTARRGAEKEFILLALWSAGMTAWIRAFALVITICAARFSAIFRSAGFSHP